MNVALTAVITVIIGFVMIVAIVVADDPMWRFTAITVVSFGFLFLTSATKLRPLGATLALIVGYALDKLGTVQIGEEATRGYLYAWLFVAIPAGVSIIVNLLMAPPPRRLAERAIALRLEIAAAMLRGSNDRLRRQFTECLREGTVEIQKWLKLAGLEKTSAPEDIAALRQAANSSCVILSAVDVTDRYAEASLPSAMREDLAQTLF